MKKEKVGTPKAGEADDSHRDPGNTHLVAPSLSAERGPVNPTGDPFVAAIQRDDVVEVEHLLASGRSPTEPLHFQRTALHFAAKAGAIRCVRLLLAKGADLGALNGLRHTPLIEAAANRRTETAAYLLQAGARAFAGTTLARTRRRTGRNSATASRISWLGAGKRSLSFTISSTNRRMLRERSLSERWLTCLSKYRWNLARTAPSCIAGIPRHCDCSWRILGLFLITFGFSALTRTTLSALRGIRLTGNPASRGVIPENAFFD